MDALLQMLGQAALGTFRESEHLPPAVTCVQIPTVPAQLGSPGADPQGLILTCCWGFPECCQLSPLALP